MRTTTKTCQANPNTCFLRCRNGQNLVHTILDYFADDSIFDKTEKKVGGKKQQIPDVKSTFGTTTYLVPNGVCCGTCYKYQA